MTSQPELFSDQLLKRGHIRNRTAAGQRTDYSGMRYGTITPTDLDAIIDFGNKAFVVVELKFKGVALSQGQKLMLERLARRLERGGAKALVLIGEHDTPPEKDVNLAEARVRSIYRSMIWKEGHLEQSVREATDRFLTTVGLACYLQGERY